ncbi:MAG: molybdopterin-dependent oxidoreductase [bacterium]|nr:molybdopterin-dependent oxidoreductase [bacterium]
MIKLTIDGKEVTTEPGRRLIDVIQEIGTEVPHYCYHKALSVTGSCRLCMVEVEKAPKPLIACNTTANDGMVVYTDTENVRKARQSVLEFLLLHHPLDCPVCDKAGECLLQDFSFKYGKGESRYTEPKRVPPYKDLGPNIMLASTRCIMCTRCVRFMEEIAGDRQLTVMNRGSKNQISVVEGEKLDHPLAGNVVDICPVGCLLDKNFVHRTRVWHLEKTNSVCGECSTGCNIKVESYKNEIFRITPRINMYVNGFWICDEGRYSNKKYNEIERLSRPKIKEGNEQKAVSWEEAVNVIANSFSKYIKTKNAVAALVSPGTTNEDAFAVKELMRIAGNSDAVSGMFTNPGSKDQVFATGFTIKGDKYPNQEGMKLVFNLDESDVNQESVLNDIESGKIKAVYFVKNDLKEIPQRTMDVLKKAEFLVVEDIADSPLTEIADVVLPGKIYLEKYGTFINYQKKLQRLQTGMIAPAGTKNTWEIVKLIAGRLNQKIQWNSANDLFLMMTKQYTDLEGLSHFKLGDTGKTLGVENQVSGTDG